jgi:hypothetical protein
MAFVVSINFPSWVLQCGRRLKAEEEEKERNRMVIHKKGRLHILVRLPLFLPKLKYHPILNKAYFFYKSSLYSGVFNALH